MKTHKLSRRKSGEQGVIVCDFVRSVHCVVCFCDACCRSGVDDNEVDVAVDEVVDCERAVCITLALGLEAVKAPVCVSLYIELTGGAVLYADLSGAVVAVQSFGASLLAAAELSDSVVEAMLGITALDSVSFCGLNSAYNFTDEETGRYRYQAIFELNWYKAR